MSDWQSLIKAPNPFRARLDPVHDKTSLMATTLSQTIWREKYAQPSEGMWADTCRRVINGIYEHDDSETAALYAYYAMEAGLWMPGGRILAGAGTSKRVTLMNCYVNAKIEDSMDSIMHANSYAALTMQQGGGIGTDFSTIRPTGAVLKRTGTKASGPLPFMDMWNAMCHTIRSAGDRRGAMMGTLCDTHPDLPLFIKAKQTKGRLTNFNVSILVSDAFMEAVKENEEWVLFFHEPPFTRDAALIEYDFTDDNMVKQYAYSVWQARELWNLILENTYEHSEPGVIFIDRVNEINNLHYAEEIRCTNPCGEQPLPPHGTCNLGHVNLARMVRHPFTDSAEFDYDLLRDVVAIGVRFLDNVIDVTNYPLQEQLKEELDKRRLGLGFTGLADAMAQLEHRYGTLKSADFAERVMRTICEAAYNTSINLAMERPSFPLLNVDKFLAPNTFAAKMLTDDMHTLIRKHGIRNGLILTVAPTGTGSCVYGNVAGGLEPTFAHRTTRKVLQPDGSHIGYTEYGYAAQVYRTIYGETEEWPAYMVEMKDLTVDDHITIMSRIQRWVDASVSKTINVPKDITYENFVRVYELAYVNGCKGCTTYRPSELRGSVLDAADDSPRESQPDAGSKISPLPEVLLERSQHLDGRTYKIKWPGRDSAIYVIINHTQDYKPYEVFITSKDGRDQEFTTALTILMTGIFRRGGDVSWIATELQQVRSMLQGHWLDKKYWPSIVAYIGNLLERHLAELAQIAEHQPDFVINLNLRQASNAVVEAVIGEVCPKCGAPGMVKEEGCAKCKSCGHSECG